MRLLAPSPPRSGWLPRVRPTAVRSRRSWPTRRSARSSPTWPRSWVDPSDRWEPRRARTCARCRPPTVPGAGAAFRRFSQWLARAHDVYVDEDSIARLRALDRQHSLLFLFSHRSYLDGALVPEVVASGRMSTPFTFGGANLNFFPMGGIASRSGVIFIKRSTSDIPVYRQALRSYIAQLLKNKANLAWSIEGGRTRTGKLRPPAFGIMRYVADAVERGRRGRRPDRARLDRLRPAARGLDDDLGGQGREEAARGPALALQVRARAEQPPRSGLRRLRRADLAGRADGRAAGGRVRGAVRHRADRPRVVPPHQPGHPGDGDRHRQHGHPRRGPGAVAGAGAGDGRADRGLPRASAAGGSPARSTSRSARRCGARCRSSSARGCSCPTTAAPRPCGGSRPTSTWSRRSTATPRSTSSSTARSASWRCWPPPRATRATSAPLPRPRRCGCASC